MVKYIYNHAGFPDRLFNAGSWSSLIYNKLVIFGTRLTVRNADKFVFISHYCQCEFIRQMGIIGVNERTGEFVWSWKAFFKDWFKLVGEPPLTHKSYVEYFKKHSKLTQ